MTKKAPFFAIALLALGCGTVRAEHVLTGSQVAPYGGDVQIVMEGAKQPSNVEEIAIVQVLATGTMAKLPTALGEMKKRAQSLGCDIVVNVRVDRSDTMSVTGVCGRKTAAASAPAVATTTDELGE